MHNLVANPQFADTPERYVELGGGRRMRFFEGGNPAGEKLLLLHGVHLNADYYRRFLFPLLGEHYHLYALDLRGHGKSFCSDELYVLENYARDVVEFQRTVIGERCYVVGMSLGGNVALTACVSTPDFAKKLVTVDIAPIVNPEGLQRIVSAQEKLPAFFPTHQALTEFFDLAYRQVSKAYVSVLLEHMWRTDEAGHYVSNYDRRHWKTPVERTVDDLNRLLAAVEVIDIPVLVLRGAQSDILSPAGAEAFMARLKHPSFIEIPDSDHGVLHEQPQACAEAIRAFLEAD